MRKFLFVALMAAMFAACGKENTQPKYNIVWMDLGPRNAEKPSLESIQEALANGADSVYLKSLETFNFDGEGAVTMNASDYVKDATAISPRVRGKGVINPSYEADQNLDESHRQVFRDAQFKYQPTALQHL
jgi:hypothetical protein